MGEPINEQFARYIRKYKIATLEQALEQLPADIARVSYCMVDAKSAHDQAEALYDRDYAKESTSQHARAKIEKFTAAEAKQWADYETIEKLLPVLKLNADYEKWKVLVTFLDNKFTSVRKLASLREVELKNIH